MSLAARAGPTIVILLLHQLGDPVIDLLVIGLAVSQTEFALGGSSDTSSVGSDLLGGISGSTLGAVEQVGGTGCQSSNTG